MRLKNNVSHVLCDQRREKKVKEYENGSQVKKTDENSSFNSLKRIERIERHTKIKS